MGDACTPDFVSVSENGTHFEVNGAPFFFGGCNTYYMMARAPLSAFGDEDKFDMVGNMPRKSFFSAVPFSPCEDMMLGILLGPLLVPCRRVQRIQASGMKSQRSWTRLKRQS